MPGPVSVPGDGSGESYYRLQCAGCHGFYGEGSDNGPALTSQYCASCSELGSLYQKILGEMPATDPSLCGEECAKRISFYIYNGFTDDYVFNGREYYSNLCAGCHGRLGEGDSGPSLQMSVCVDCGDITTLYQKILQDMPKGSAPLCDEACSESVAQYIAEGFKLSPRPMIFLPLARACSQLSK